MFLVALVMLAFFFQGVVDFSMFVTVMVVSAFWYDAKPVLMVGLLLGLIADALMMRVWGVTSILLMSIGLVIYAFRVQLEWQRITFVMGVAVLFEVVWQLWWGEQVMWYELLEQGFVVWLLWMVRQLTATRDAVYLRH